jgi:hypothetical protein
MAKRIDGSDTVDNATHLLHRLQADGWVTQSVKADFEYGEIPGGRAKIPVRSFVIVELIPGRD